MKKKTAKINLVSGNKITVAKMKISNHSGLNRLNQTPSAVVNLVSTDNIKKLSYSFLRLIKNINTFTSLFCD